MLLDRAHPRPTFRSPPAPGLWSALSEMVARRRRDLCGGYHPERHYMRGPGPACRSKHAG
jgi:hypothetical protein